MRHGMQDYLGQVNLHVENPEDTNRFYRDFPILAPRKYENQSANFMEAYGDQFERLPGNTYSLSMGIVNAINRSLAVYGGEGLIRHSPELVAHFLPDSTESLDPQTSQFVAGDNIDYIRGKRRRSSFPDYFSDIIDKTIGHIFRECPDIFSYTPNGDDAKPNRENANPFLEDFIKYATADRETLGDYMEQVATRILVSGKVLVYIDHVETTQGSVPILRTIDIDQVEDWKVNLGDIEYIRLRPTERRNAADELEYRQVVIYSNPYRMVTYLLEEEDNVANEARFTTRQLSNRVIMLNGRRVDKAPAFFIGYKGLSFLPERPPMSKTVNALDSLFQKTSDWHNAVRLAGNPQIFVKSDNVKVRKSAKSIISSSGQIIGMTKEDDIGYLEVEGNGLSSMKDVVDQIASTLDEACPTVGVSTQSESGFALSIKANAQSGFMVNFSNALCQAFKDITEVLTNIYGLQARISITPTNNFLMAGCDSDALKDAVDFYIRGIITPEVLAYRFKCAGWFPPDMTVDEFVESIAIILEQRQAEQQVSQALDASGEASEEEQEGSQSE